MTRLSERWRPIAALAAAGLLAACGTRLPDEAFEDVGTEGVGVESASGVRPGSGTTNRPATGGSPTATAGPGATVAGATTPDPAAGGAAPDGGGGEPGAVAAAGPNQASDVGVTETTLRIGTIVAENGVLGNTFQPAATGLRSWVEHVNAQGGVAGRTIELFTCDDREDRARTLECARRLVEQDQVFALIATNTRSMGGASAYLAEQDVPVLGNPINNAFYRFPNFFSVYGAPYARDGATVGHGGQIASYSTQYRWMRENLGVTKAAVFSYDIAESAQAGDFFQKGLESEGFEVSRYVVSFAAPAFDAPVADMQRKGIQLVYDSMDAGANIRLCDAIARRGFEIKGKVSTIPVMGATFGDRFNDACRNVTYIVGDSLPFTENHPYVAAYRDGMQRYQRGKELHQWGFEAWIMGQLLQDALTAMGPAPTRDGFMEHLRGLRRSDVGGVMTPTIQWVPNDPDLGAATIQDCISISKWDDGAGGWTLAAPFPYCVPNAKQYFTRAAEQGT